MNLIAASVLSAWLISQILKAAFSRNKKNFFECGGMPSSHSAFVSALCTSAGILEGFGSAIFLITLAFSIIIVHDAVRIRKQHTIKEIAVGAGLGIAVTLLIRVTFF